MQIDVARLAWGAGYTIVRERDGTTSVLGPGGCNIMPQLTAVALATIEECAKVCDERVDAEYLTGKVDHNEMGWTQACAIAIRARGEK